MKRSLALIAFLFCSLSAETDSSQVKKSKDLDPDKTQDLKKTAVKPAAPQEEKKETLKPPPPPEKLKPPAPPPRPRRRRPDLSPQEQEFIDRRQENVSRARKKKAGKKPRTPSAPVSKIKKSAITEQMKIEVVDQPITNLFRMISKTYKINIVPEADLSGMNVTINLEDISVMDGLRVICTANGLEMNEVDEVIYIQKASEKAIAEMNLYSKRIDIKVENKPVKEFIKEFADKTKISIVPGQDLEGKVTGHLNNVLPVNGFKAIMAANDYSVRQKAGIYLVENLDTEEEGRRRVRGPSRPTGPIDIDVMSGKVTASLKSADLRQSIRAITDQSGMNMISYGEISGSVDAELKEVSVNKALSVLLQGTKYTFIIKDGIVLVGERNPKTTSGAVLSTVELHNLKYVRADQAIKLLPKSISEGATVVKEQNAILITGTAETITRIKDFLEQVDMPVPQVLIEVVIVEYDRSSGSEFGIDKGTGAADNPSLAANVDISGASATYRDGSFTGAIRFLPQNWNLHLRANLEKNRGKVLAMPKVTTLNGNKAHLRVRRTNYHPVTSFNKDGFQSTDFRAIDDGITIDLTPWVTRHGDVNLEIKPSIKTSQPSNAPNRPAPVTDRAITTNVRLRDGETLILGGLIDSKETSLRKFVPILGHIPLLGYLFSWRSKSLSTTELVLYVTPHILGDEDLGVDLVEELEELDSRGGFIKDKHFMGKPKKDKEEAQEK
ncbi:type II secretion system protein GspD [Fibrobacterota bacterium]